MNVSKMAWRNVMRNRRRTTITVGAMTFALVVELLYSGLIPGFVGGMEDDVVNLEVGDIQVFAGAYLERPSLYEVIPEPEQLLQKLDAAGYPAAPRLSGGALVASGENSAGVNLRGVEIERDKNVTLISERVAKGVWLDASDPKGVVVGKVLARVLGIEPGAELVVLAQASDGSMANELFTVRGVLQSIAAGTDRSAVYLPAQAFRDLMVFPDGAHQLIVRRPRAVPLEEAAKVVSAMVLTQPGEVKAMTWKQIMPVVGAMLDGTKSLIAIMGLIFYVAVGILVLNAMLMAVFERIREFGVLKAIGTSPGKVFSLILVESFIQTAMATVLGIVLAIPGMWYLTEYGIDVGGLGGTDMMGVAMRPVWHGIYSLDVLIGPMVLLFFVVLLSVIYPATKAALIQPVEAMHHQ